MTRPVPAASRLVLLAICTLTGAGAARAEVLFQNPGNNLGWDRLFTQKAGTITVVSSPVFKGTTAVKTTQTYQRSDGANYHSEIIKAKAHLAGQDLYYGHAVYLPPDWVFHGQNVTFQQWAPEQPEAPWVLMYMQGDRLRLGGRGAMGDKDAGSVAGLKGTWINFITRIHMATDGVFEVWINGQRTFSQRGNWRAHGPSMRWSNGIYATRWDTETPTGPRELTFFHDNLRIATTYAEADPATWGDGDGPPPGDGGAGPRSTPARPPTWASLRRMRAGAERAVPVVRAVRVAPAVRAAAAGPVAPAPEAAGVARDRRRAAARAADQPAAEKAARAAWHRWAPRPAPPVVRAAGSGAVNLPVVRCGRRWLPHWR